MNDINQSIICGRIVWEPEFRLCASGVAVATLTIASNRRWKDTEETAFVPCVIFGKPAEWTKDHHKGEFVIASGRLRTDSWERDGTNHSRLVLIAENICYTQRNQNHTSEAGPTPNRASTTSTTETRRGEDKPAIPF